MEWCAAAHQLHHIAHVCHEHASGHAPAPNTEIVCNRLVSFTYIPKSACNNLHLLSLCLIPLIPPILSASKCWLLLSCWWLQSSREGGGRRAGACRCSLCSFGSCRLALCFIACRVVHMRQAISIAHSGNALDRESTRNEL